MTEIVANLFRSEEPATTTERQAAFSVAMHYVNNHYDSIYREDLTNEERHNNPKHEAYNNSLRYVKAVRGELYSYLAGEVPAKRIHELLLSLGQPIKIQTPN